MSSGNRESDLKETGDKIRERRKELHLTQEKLAEKIGGGMTNREISRYERGESAMMLPRYFEFLDELGATPNDLAPDRYREKSQDDQRARYLSDQFRKLDDKCKDTAYSAICAMFSGFSGSE